MNRLFDLPLTSAHRAPAAHALKAGQRPCSYAELVELSEGFGRGLIAGALRRQDRVAVFADKSVEAVAALFGTSCAGGVLVPVNPLLKPEQVVYILRDCNVVTLATSSSRLRALRPLLRHCPDLRQVVLLDADGVAARADDEAGADAAAVGGQRVQVHAFRSFAAGGGRSGFHDGIDADMAAILYTSGSTGNPKGVVLSHRNLVAGAESVASYLGNHAGDRILAALPLSFDYGLSQLTTAFLTGATAVLHNYLLPKDLLRALAQEEITGLAAVPPLWMQLTALPWPASINRHLRYFTNSGGALPTATLGLLRSRVPDARPFLMYGLTEAFRSTFLAPEEIDRRPTSIGKAIPNAEVLVVRQDGSECATDEPGELVHRGALVSMGYWNDRERTNERFRPAPGRRAELMLPELAVWSGDTVKRDADGFLYFVSRQDEMIKTSGYRISPTEVEEAVFRTGRVAEAAAFGVAHPTLGQAIVLVARPLSIDSAETDNRSDTGNSDPAGDTDALLAACREFLPGFMLPAHVDWQRQALPRNANGKIDRRRLAAERKDLFLTTAAATCK